MGAQHERVIRIAKALQHACTDMAIVATHTHTHNPQRRRTVVHRRLCVVTMEISWMISSLTPAAADAMAAAASDETVNTGTVGRNAPGYHVSDYGQRTTAHTHATANECTKQCTAAAGASNGRYISQARDHKP